jgi:hypothetical protein
MRECNKEEKLVREQQQKGLSHHFCVMENYKTNFFLLFLMRMGRKRRS